MCGCSYYTSIVTCIDIYPSKIILQRLLPGYKCDIYRYCISPLKFDTCHDTLVSYVFSNKFCLTVVEVKHKSVDHNGKYIGHIPPPLLNLIYMYMHKQ